MRIYISGAITGVKDLTPYERLGEHLSRLGHVPFIPHLSNVPETEIYDFDEEELKRADVMVVCLDTPSFGVGSELEKFRGHVIAFTTKDNISPYVLGLLDRKHSTKPYKVKDEAAMFHILEKLL